MVLISFMKLYDILFEQKTNYFTKPFALVYNKNSFVLYDTSKFPNDYIAAFIKVKIDPTNCPSVIQVAQSVRGQNYPGAGEALYQIVSSVLQKPITSDRTISTSQDAQKMWKKIETGSQFNHIKLDNWIWNDDYETKTYAHNINKINNSYTPSSEPATPQKEDDCILPGDSVNKDNPNLKPSIEILGTPNAHQANVDFSILLKNHEEFIKNKPFIDISKLFNDGEKTFTQRYGS